jgi:hypothetical protein
VGEHEPAKTTAPYDASADQQTHEPVLLTAAALFALFLIVLVLLPAATLLHAVVEHVGEEQATQTAATYPPPDQKASKSAIFHASFLTSAVDVGTCEELIYSRCAS